MLKPVVIDMETAAEAHPAKDATITTTWDYTFVVEKPMGREEFIQLVRDALTEVGNTLPQHLLDELNKRNLLEK